jgi:ArsR family transcriptional regulator
MNRTTATPLARAAAPSNVPIGAAEATADSIAVGLASEAACCPAIQLPPEPRLDLPAPEVTDAVAAAALLADRTRAGIMAMLAEGPHCVCEMAAALGERQNNVSMHLARLREAGLVRATRHSGDARWIFYERDEERCAATAAAIAGLLR